MEFNKNNSRHQIIALVVIAFLSGFFSCSEEQPIIPAPPAAPDTTSHDFKWETYYLGDAQSMLRDIYAINDTDAWAVGSVFIKDSTGQLDWRMYNAAHWDGREWKLFRLPALIYTGDTARFSEILSVCALSTDDVWMFSIVGAFIHWNGKIWETGFVSERKGSVIKIHANGRSDIYFAGTNGSITHWDGSSFKLMESGTTTDLFDISGVFRGKAYACGGEFSGTVLEYDGEKWSTIDSLKDSRKGRWTVCAMNDFFAVGGMELKYIDFIKFDTLRMPPIKVMEGGLGQGHYIVTTSVRASSRNNVFAIGDWQYVLHYNGKSWHWYDDLWDMGGHTQYSLSVTDNSVFITGRNNDRATVLHGTRIK